MKGDRKTVGMVRTNRLTRAIGMFPTAALRRVDARRSRVGETQKDIYKDWISERINEMRTYDVHWSWWETGATFEVDKVLKLIRERDLGEMTVEFIEFEFKDPKVVVSLKDPLDAEARRAFPLDTKLYATFKNNVSAEVRKDPYVMALNAEECREYHMRYGSLDLVRLETERAKKYGEKERIPVFDWPEVARQVLSNLDPKGWPRDDREVTVNGSVCFPKPFALRRYQATSKKGWALVGTEEV